MNTQHTQQEGGLRYAADGLFYTRDLTIGTAYGRWC
jgi:hypothetical protein